MLSRVLPAKNALRCLGGSAAVTAIRCNSTLTVKHDPLRILFCGADDFSIYSLRALHELQQRRGDKVDSIDVVCRPDKPVGRGYKRLEEVPIKGVTTELGLGLHQIDTFKGWLPPKPIDLVVAVSFGLLVPARLLSEAKYGGLNIHPSLLPEFRGSAPIQHALLNRRTRSGVTLQTMHPTRFDHGEILDQRIVDITPGSTPKDLMELFGPVGAEMLSKGVENGIFMPPLSAVGKGDLDVEPSYAPKITQEDRRVDWSTWTADDIVTRDRVLGQLWDITTYSQCMYLPDDVGPVKRVMFEGPWTVHEYNRYSIGPELQPGQPAVLPYKQSTIGIKTIDNKVAIPSVVSVEGEPKHGGRQKLAHGLKTILTSRSTTP